MYSALPALKRIIIILRIQVSDQVAEMNAECVITKDNTIYNNDVRLIMNKITIKVPRADKINLKRDQIKG